MNGCFICEIDTKFLNFATIPQELLALGEQIGSVVTGLSEEAIRRDLKVGTFASSATCSSVDRTTCVEQEINFCVICQVLISSFGTSNNEDDCVMWCLRYALNFLLVSF